MRPSNWAQHLSTLREAIGRTRIAGQWQAASRWAARLRDYLVGYPEIAPGEPWPATWLRPKGHLSRGGLVVLLTVGLLPLLTMIIRISAWPGVLGPGMNGTLLPAIGYELNQMFSLTDISASDRNHVLYLLFVPTGAILIALTRLTFGIRLIGFRSILISVGFQQSGFVPSLVLIGVMVCVVVGIRPALIRLHLPYYARVAVIMSVSVLLMLSALLIAPMMRSEVIWGVAFFPVLVLGLMAEGIAKTMDQDNGLTAFWRTAMTIVVAMVLAGISHIPVVREIAIEFPELVLTQIVMIILISEFLDLRLLQHLDAKLSGLAPPLLFSESSALRIAVVRNHRRSGVISRLGLPSRGGYRRRSVRRIVDNLRSRGHSVKVMEGDMSLLSRLEAFMPAHPMTGQPGGIVLNLSHGIQGDAAAAHVPAMLEMAGLAYTGPTPLGMMVTLDRVVARILLQEAGIPTPDFRVGGPAGHEFDGVRYPVVVTPRAHASTRPRIASDRQQLTEALRQVALHHGQQGLVEPLVAGREIEIAIVGNTPGYCLPLIEILPGKEGKVCPAEINAGLDRSVRAVALAAFRACRCRDYALINVRIAPSGQPLVIQVGTDGVLEEGESFELAAEAAGWTFGELVQRILDVARERYRPEVATPARDLVPAHGLAGAGAGNGGTLVAG